MTALVCVAACFAAGCHRNNQDSGGGVAWVTLTDSPGDFASYIVNVDSISLTRSDGAVVTALGTIETVDFTKLSNIAELWGTATIPIGTYTSASLIVDYTNAVISVMVNGVPQKATVVDSAGQPVTTVTISVALDPAAPLVLQPTYATTAAQRLALDFNLAASTSSINLSTTPATVTVKPFFTAAVAAPDNKLIRIRGPLINSSVSLGTFTLYVRPFYDEADNLGLLTLFSDANTIYTINGVASVGTTGLTQLSQSSAGSTLAAAYATYEPTATPSATAGKYMAKYVVAGSTLEDNYTQGIEGDVVGRVGNTLQVRGGTVQFNNGGTIGTTTYEIADSYVIVGPNTIVTVDDQPGVTGLNYNSVAVGQYISARGEYTAPNGVVTLDSTGNSSTNTGSVRLRSTNLFGTLVSSGTGSAVLNVATIDNWPVSAFAFAGNGTSATTDPTAANFVVNTGALTLPDTTVGDPLFIDGRVTPFGSAPPDFTATNVNAEATVPASLRVYWTPPGTSTPFSTLTATAMTVDLASANFASAVLKIGSETIDATTLPASPQIVPQTGTGTAGLPATFTPLFAYGDPTTVSPAVGISVFSVFPTFTGNLPAALAAKPALQFEARGFYDRSTNTFSASSINVVL